MQHKSIGGVSFERLRFSRNALEIILHSLLLIVLFFLPSESRGQEVPQYQPGTDELSGTIRLNGSETMQPLLEAWSVEFMRLHPKVQFEMRLEGSLLAVASLAEKVASIGAVSRELTAKEIKNLAILGVDNLLQIPVARDHIAVIAHPANPLTSLSRDQLKEIFQARSVPLRWNQVDDRSATSDLGITLVGPNELSGTRDNFAQMLFGDSDQMSGEIKSCDSQSSIIEEVLRTPGALGILSQVWLDDSTNALAISEDNSKPAILPSTDDAKEGSYPLERELYLVVRSSGELKPSLTERRFLDFTLSQQGIRVVKRSRFLPLSPERTEVARRQIGSLSSVK